MQKRETSRRTQINVVQDNFIRSHFFFGAAVKGRCMEDLLGSLLLTTVSQNGPKISPRGVYVEMPQLNAALMSALESVEWFVLRPSFLF